MSNHFSADNLKFPGDDRRLDLTDVFVFQAPDEPGHHHGFPHRHHPGTTVLIMDSNPTSAPPPIEAQAKGPAFYPGEVTREIRPDWDLADSRLRENWQAGDHSMHYPYEQADRIRTVTPLSDQKN